MRKRDVEQLELGLYRLYWKKKAGGGVSLASVGMLYDGTRWFAATNWTAKKEADIASTSWKRVKRVELVERPA